ncbi:MAG: aromatic hydrocarbon degradation protein, partial [Saprospiraceae bacterium]
MKKITILFAFMLGLMAINAQNASDILRYSTRQPLGSARYVGVGGSMGAIGADFGAISDNPAGL